MDKNKHELKKKTEITTFRMQIYTECKTNGKNIFNLEVCQGDNDSIKACMESNISNAIGDY